MFIFGASVDFGMLFVAYTMLVLIVATVLVHYEDKTWFRDWYIYALLAIGGPGVWLILFFWWVRSRIET